MARVKKGAGTAALPALPGAPRRVIFTIVSANYIGFAATLMQSVRAHHPEAARYIILSDAMRDFADIDLAAELLGCENLGIDLLDNMKFWYTVIEFNTAVKPNAFRYFMDGGQADQIVYIDPDILLFSPLDDVFGGLVDHSIVLTPHMMVPLQDGKQPDDLSIMKSGIYNLGFLAIANNADARGLIDWWADRCFATCRVDIPGNMFTDQRWMDMAPVLVAKPLILRHPGYNVAYWNLPHRAVICDTGGVWRVNGQALKFFHFSGIKPDDPTQFSKHQNRYTIDNLGEVAILCGEYREKVLANHWARYAKTPYAFANFADGRVIDEPMRHWVARAVSAGVLDARGALQIGSDFFDSPEDALTDQGIFMTRFMYQFWLDRADLMAAFDARTKAGAENYTKWFLSGDAARQGVGAANVEAARRLTAGGDTAVEVVDISREPPWVSLACQAWPGAARDAGQFVNGDIDLSLGLAGVVLIPRAVALVWERRVDLQAHFPLRDAANIKQFFNWAMTSGLREGAVSGADFSVDFVAWFSKISVLSDHYGDVPITEGMVMVHPGGIGQVADRWRRFPVERVSRLSHGLWFAYMAPGLFGWPAALTAPVRRYFLKPAEITIDGLRLSLGMMALWELRSDVQQSFPLSDPRTAWRFLRWCALHASREYHVTLADLHSGFEAFLDGASPRVAGLSQIQEMIHDMRADLRAKYDVTSAAGVAGYLAWCAGNLQTALGKTGLVAARAQPRTDAAVPVVVDVAVVLSGQYSTPSGRGEDVRGTAEALEAVGFTDYAIVDLIEKTLHHRDGTLMAPGIILRAQHNIVHMNADTAEQDWRKLRDLRVEAARVIGFWAWELDRLPSYWRYAYSFFDEIWAATHFAMGAFLHESLRPVRFMPMVVTAPETDGALGRAALGLAADETVFLFMFDFRSYLARKNPEAVIDAFTVAFPKGDERVRLVIKTQGGAEMPERMAGLRARAKDTRIDFRDVNLSRVELMTLLTSMDAFVSLHRSEGFGRGPAEAMLLGKVAIVTDYSGTTDFATAACALLVDYTLVAVDPAEYTGVEGQAWADANVQTAARHMRWVAKNPKRAQALGEKARARIMALYNPAAIGAAVLQAIDIDRPNQTTRPAHGDDVEYSSMTKKLIAP